MTLLELFHLLRKHLRLVILLPIACAVVTGVYAFFLPNQYTASTSMYVLSKSTAVTQGDLSASQMLTNDVATLIKSDRVKGDVAKQLGLDNLNGYSIDVTSSTTTRVIDLTVTGTDPNVSAQVANALVTDVSEVAAQVMNVQSVNVIDSAVAPTTPSGPKRALYMAVAFLAGFFVAIVIVVVADMADTRVRNSKDAEEIADLPVVGHFPKVEGM
jgi:capsular polysaccharide biosynthesis protein